MANGRGRIVNTTIEELRENPGQYCPNPEKSTGSNNAVAPFVKFVSVLSDVQPLLGEGGHMITVCCPSWVSWHVSTFLKVMDRSQKTFLTCKQEDDQFPPYKVGSYYFEV